MSKLRVTFYMQVKTFKFTDGFAGKAICCPGFILQILAVPGVLKNARTIKFLYFVGLSDFVFLRQRVD